MHHISPICVWLACIATSSAQSPDQARPPKVQVFLLAGQSNMEGHGQIESLVQLGEDEAHAPLLSMLRAEDGTWAVRDDVSLAWQAKQPNHGPLTVGWGASPNEVGPELMFGTLVGERLEAPVLLIKTAWGGKDVFCDFRSPSAGEPSGAAAALLAEEREGGRERVVGASYRSMVQEIQSTLERLNEIVPGYAGQGYELRGMAWFQGWNDYCRWHESPTLVEEYPATLAAMFRDLRIALDAPDLPIAVGELGVGGLGIERRAQETDSREAKSMVAFRRAQRAVAQQPELEGVSYVPTALYWDERLEELRQLQDQQAEALRRAGTEQTAANRFATPELDEEFRRRGGHWYCHYNGSAAHYSLVGMALANALCPE